MRSRWVVCLVGAVLAIAGCAQEAREPALPRPIATRRADVALAASILLTRDDLPAGWTVEPGRPQVQLVPAYDADPAHCQPADEPGLLNVPHALSPTFVAPAGDSFFAAVGVWPDDTSPRRLIERYRDEAAPGCLAASITATWIRDQTSEPGAATLDSATGEPLPFDHSGDETVAIRLTSTVSDDGAEAITYSDLVLVRVGRVVINASFAATGDPFDDDRSKRLVRIMIERAIEADAG